MNSVSSLLRLHINTMDSQVNNVIFSKTKPQGGRIEKLLVSCKRVVTGNFLAMLFNQVEPDKLK